MMNIGIYIYEQAEVLDFSGPFEVFSTAKRLDDSAVIGDTFLIGETGATVTARGGYLINPHYALTNHPDIDLLVVVGGVHTAEMDKQPVLEWIQTQAQTAQLVASVCTGAFLLAEAGVLSTEIVTTHWEDLSDLRERYPNLQVVGQRRWVDTGKIITSAGISAGIDMSLHLISKIHSLALAEKTARQMEFDWTKNAKTNDQSAKGIL